MNDDNDMLYTMLVGYEVAYFTTHFESGEDGSWTVTKADTVSIEHVVYYQLMQVN